MTLPRQTKSTNCRKIWRRRQDGRVNRKRQFRPTLEELEQRSLLATFVVTNTGDSGIGSLRQAIDNANATPMLDEIHFRIPGAGVRTITPATPLPIITQPVVIDGYTQDGNGDGNPDASPNTLATGNNAVLLIELNGLTVATSGAGLHFQGSGSTVRGLVINHSFLYGVYFESGGSNTIAGSFIGTDSTGSASPTGFGNLVAGVKVESPSNLIGGSTPADRNVISGNGYGFSGGHPGIILNGANSSSNRIEGNYVGINAAGTSALQNSGHNILLLNVGNNNRIGGLTSTPGTGVGNVISGCNTDAIRIEGTGLGHVIQGNIIGLNATGSEIIGNAGHGIQIGGMSITVGGTDVQARNIISGNRVGISISGGNAGNIIQGNYIGTDISGMLDRGNGWGIFLNSTHNTLIGGTAPGAGNVISGSGHTFSGGQGVSAGVGIDIEFFSSWTTIQGNYIGVAADGVSPLGNAADGIEMPRAHNTLIGGTVPGAANVIAYSGNDSHVPGGAATSRGNGLTIIEGVGNAFLGNRIYNNTSLGIDLFDDGVTPNDAGDADSGHFSPVNYLQNYPVLSSVTTTGSSTTIIGSLNSTVNTTYRIEFFANTVADASGFGEGQTYIGFTTVTTDANGDGSFNVTLPVAVPVAEFVTGTATDPAGNTSEFSQVRSVAPGNSPPLFTSPPVTTATEDASYTYAVTTDDPDAGQARTIAATTLPSWLTFVDHGNSTATLSGTPTNAEVGSHCVELVVTDAVGALATQSFLITVANVNDAPYFTSTGVTAAAQDTVYSYAVTTADPDAGDTRAITSATLPSWLTLVDHVNGTATLSGTPTNIDVGSHSVSLVVTDVAGTIGVQSFQIVVSAGAVNFPPQITTLRSSSPDCGCTGEGDEVTLEGSFLDANLGDTHTVTINWGDGTMSQPMVNQSDQTFAGQHVYADGGIYTTTVTVADNFAASDSETTSAVISGVAIHDGVLQIIGTNHDDHVTVNEQGSGLLKVHADFLPGQKFRTFNAADVDRIMIVLCDGDDDASIAGNLAITSILDGGEGNDHLNGGRGPNIVIGGDGDDMLIGNSARDLIIGGLGADRLVGNGGDDLLIGGKTAYDQDFAALLYLLTEWNSSLSYAARVTRLRAGSAVVLDDRTVFDDDASDVLTGSAQQDWFFFVLGSDQITDRKANEETN